MVRADVVRERRGRALAWLHDAKAILVRPVAELQTDRRERDLALFYLFLAIQEVLDLASHWIASSGWTPPEDFRSAFEVLGERGVVDASDSEILRGAAGLRNRIGHGYGQIDFARVHREAQEGIPALERFLDAIDRAAGSG